MIKPRVLFVANIAKHIIRFHLPYLKWFQEQGFETHVATSGNEAIPFCNVKHIIPIERSPFSFKNITAHKILKKIIEENNFTIVHGHTPMGGILARTASIKSRKKGTKVLYTTHGFYFYKGGPLIYWLTFYPIELILSLFTDAIITINDEDYQLIKKKESPALKIFKIPGIGVTPKCFYPVSQDEKFKIRKKNGFDSQDFILIYAAEFIRRKNHQFIIDTTSKLLKEIPNCKILFAGRGLLLEELQNNVNKLKLNNIIYFLGYREDIDQVYKMSDIGISSSKVEGLGLNLVEEMMCGLPIVATIDKGHKEVVDNNATGFLFQQGNGGEFIKLIKQLKINNSEREKMSKLAIEKSKKFELSNSLFEMTKIYEQFL